MHMTDVKIYDEMKKLVDEVAWSEYILSINAFADTQLLRAETDQMISKIKRFAGYIRELREIKVSPNDRTTIETKTIRDFRLIEFANSKNVEPPPPVQADLPNEGRIA